MTRIRRIGWTRRSQHPRTLRKRRWIWIVVAIVIALLILADRGGWLLHPAHDDFARYHEALARVARIIDGDTIEVAMPDLRTGRDVTRIRLWGLDCQEIRDTNSPARTVARDARQFAEEEVLHRMIALRLEAHQSRDSFGRILAHVDLERGTSLNRLLLLQGLARTDERWPHSRLFVYKQAELAARRARIGIWSSD